MKLKLAGAIVLLLALGGSAHADILNVSADASFMHQRGLASDPGPIVLETFTTSFNWDNAAGTMVPGTFSDSFSGPLQGFVLMAVNGDRPLFDWFADGAALQIDMFEAGQSAIAVGTHNPASEMGFYSSGWLNNPLAGSFLTVSTVDTPEPSTLLMLLSGLALMVGWYAVKVVLQFQFYRGELFSFVPSF